MKKSIILAISIIFFFFIVSCRENNAFKITKENIVMQEYKGIILSNFYPIENGFVAKSIFVFDEQLIISNEKEYNDFISKIYPDEVTKTNPAPESNDPLLKKPKIDFNKNMMVVFIRNDGIYGNIELKEIKDEKDSVVFVIDYLPLTEESIYMSQPGFPLLGVYKAYIIKKIDKEIRFSVIN